MTQREYKFFRPLQLCFDNTFKLVGTDLEVQCLFILFTLYKISMKTNKLCYSIRIKPQLNAPKATMVYQSKPV